jgi:hypothetical protein
MTADSDRGHATVLDAVYDEIRSQLARDVGSVDTLRTMALTLLSASGVIAGLFASRLGFAAKDASNLTLGCESFALLCFTVSVALAVIVVFPRTWTFEERMQYSLGLSSDPALTVESWKTQMSARYIAYHDENRSAMACRYRAIAWIAILLGAQVAAWGIGLAG